MKGLGDPAVQAHLSRVRDLYAGAGAIDFVQEVVRDTWQVNRERWSPERHFDDRNTLGYQTSRNVNNRIYRTMETSNVASTVRLETEPGVSILGLAGFRLRVVKAPIESGLAPDLKQDFDWSGSATRVDAARRNSNNYYPILADELTFDFEDDPRPERLRRIEACRDVFLLWAAELTSNRTAGWLGIPQLGDLPLMGILDLWEDGTTEHDGSEPVLESKSIQPTHHVGYAVDDDEEEDE
jgi:hypothetical protein